MNRDQQILESLEKFRVLDRDQLIELHFSNLKDSVTSCNKVMRRLVDRKKVEVDRSVRPSNYFPSPSPIKKNSSKLQHFKEIGEFYLEAMRLGRITEFEVEFKTGEKGSVEPDILMVWNHAPFFVEIQRTIYSQKEMNKKLQRYVKYYESEDWKQEFWNTTREKKVFPYVLMITQRKYQTGKLPFLLIQSTSFKEFYDSKIKKRP